VDRIVVQGTPLPGGELDQDWAPSRPQVAGAAEIAALREVGLPRFLATRLGGVHLNDAQNNPLQPDLQYRGYTASPLLGLSQGLAVYQDGVRLNEPFGDVVHWDLIPEAAVSVVELLPGADPLFGLNALGGALSLRMKDGFSHAGHRLGVSGGSFGRVELLAESGGNRGGFGYHLTYQDLGEDGWRDESRSDASRLHARLSWRSERTEADLSLGWAGTQLRGNGPSPVDLLDRDRAAVFTYPDATRNRYQSYGLQLRHSLGDRVQLAGLAYYRALRTRSFNGDATEFVACQQPANAGLLCEDDEELGSADEEVIVDDRGAPASDALDAIENRSQTSQAAFGFALQGRLDHGALGRPARLLAGMAMDGGDVRFASSVGLAALRPDRGTTGTGQRVPAERVAAHTERHAWSVHASERVFLRDDLQLTLSARLAATRIELRDRTGLAPELEGTHRFSGLDPALGLTWQPREGLALFGAYRQSSRAPTPVELACASPQAPCNLPNSFLADPPLDRVVTRTAELGLRGGDPGRLQWSVTGFAMRNSDDILFVSTGGVTSNEGFFDNVADTRRLGVELGLRGALGPLSWRLDYTHLRAEFGQGFDAPSAHHPFADGEGRIEVERGDRIPGIPRNLLKAGLELAAGPALRFGLDLVAQSDQYLRGDEANRLEAVDGYATLALRAEWSATAWLRFHARVENVLDSEYETFGALGEPESVLGPAFDDPRFLSPGAPRALWVGAELEF
jgi:outer membrane receptor protein involved in Fe transport